MSSNETQLALPLITDRYQDALGDVMRAVVRRHKNERYLKRIAGKAVRLATNYGMGPARLADLVHKPL